MGRVTVYMRDSCPFCVKALTLLEEVIPEVLQQAQASDSKLEPLAPRPPKPELQVGLFQTVPLTFSVTHAGAGALAERGKGRCLGSTMHQINQLAHCSTSVPEREVPRGESPHPPGLDRGTLLDMTTHVSTLPRTGAPCYN